MSIPTALLEAIASALCALSAVVCAVLTRTHHLTAFTALQIVSMVWMVSGIWINERFNPLFKALRNRPLGESYRLAKSGQLPKGSPAANIMSMGGVVMMVIGFIFFL